MLDHHTTHPVRRLLALVVIAGLVVAACGNATDDDGAATGGADAPSDSSEVPGVTDTTIRVGGVIAKTGPLGQQFAGSEPGFRAYIDYVNDELGGVHGRTIEIVKVANDNTDSARNLEEAKALVEQDGVFAVAPISTPVFGAAQFLADEGVPTFGWAIQDEWRFGANLIGYPATWPRDEEPPVLPAPGQSYIARKLGASKVGVITYTAPQSKQCGEAAIENFERFGLDVVFEDLSLPLGTTNFAADVEKMKESGVEYLQTCIDVNGNVNLARTMEREQVDIPLSWPTGYEEETLESFGDLLEDVYFTTSFLPFQSADESEGLQLYLAELPAREPDAEIGNQTLIGWINAMMLVQALDDAGPDPTREAVVEAVRGYDAFDADGIIPPTDYTTPPEERGRADCGGAVVTVEDGAFVPVFTQPFLCLGSVDDGDDLDALIAQEEAAG